MVSFGAYKSDEGNVIRISQRKGELFIQYNEQTAQLLADSDSTLSAQYLGLNLEIISNGSEKATILANGWQEFHFSEND